MIYWRIEVLEHVSSTQDEILKSLDKPEGLVIQALNQSKGRGRHGNAWDSQSGNLMMSLLLKPSAPREDWGQLSYMIAVAFSRAFENLQLKWPNDILKDGRKCAGILIETEGDAAIAGIGVNIQTAPEGAAKIEGDISDIQGHLLAAIGDAYAHWQEEGFAPIRTAWLEKAYRLGQEIRVRTAIRDEIGIFEGIDENGGLLLKTPENAITAIHAGEVIL